jgi:hypothetical protein
MTNVDMDQFKTKIVVTNNADGKVIHEKVCGNKRIAEGLARVYRVSEFAGKDVTITIKALT